MDGSGTATPGAPGKRPKRQDATEAKKRPRKQEPSLSRLTARQLTVARLVSSYKYECKKMLQSLGERQRRWKREVDGTLPVMDSPLSKAAVPAEPGNADADPPVGTPRLETAVQETEEAAPWRQAERDALRRCFFAFGFDRWDAIEVAVKEALQSDEHSREDMEAACWELLAEVEDNLEGEDREYLSKKLDAVRNRMPFRTPGIPWNRVQKASGKTWVRRLQLLENVAVLNRLVRDSENRSLFKETILAAQDATLPAPWWNPDLDLLFLSGVYEFGFGNYEPIRLDTKFCRTYKKSCVELGLKTGSRFKKNKCEMVTDWPAVETLNRRLKRVTELLMKTLEKSDHSCLVPGPEWSRQDKLNVLRSLMMFGLPQDFPQPVNDPQMQNRFLVETGALLKNAGMAGLNAADGLRLCQEILTEMETVIAAATHTVSDQAAEQRNEASGVPTETEPYRCEGMVLTPYSAVCLRERLELLHVLKTSLHLLKHTEFLELLRRHSTDIPSWWAEGVHDHELLMGIFVRGFGAWSGILQSPSFSFLRCISLFEKTQRKIAVEMTADASALAAVERVAADMGVSLTPEAVSPEHIPPARWFTARCNALYALMKAHAPQMEGHFPARIAQLRHQPEWLARLSAGTTLLRAPYTLQMSQPIQNLQLPQPVAAQNPAFSTNVLSVRPAVAGVSAPQPRTVLMLNTSQSIPSLQQLRPGLTLTVRPYVPLAVQQEPDRESRPPRLPPSQPEGTAIFHNVPPQIILTPQPTSTPIPSSAFQFPPSRPIQ